MVSDPLRVALEVARIFDSLGIPYVIGGALASAILGEPRATEDIDVVADIRPQQTETFVAGAGRKGHWTCLVRIMNAENSWEGPP